ncbi:hypothetical protein Tco_0335999 [Tanacetum coccineum]
MSSPKFAETYNAVAFLEKPEESDGFAEIIDFLKASSVSYALTVNPVIYTSCIEQFWATAKVQTVNGVRQLQALVDKKRVIVTESSIRRDLHLDDAEGTDCLPTATIFEELARMGSSMASLIICLATNQKFNLSKFIFAAYVKHLDGGVKSWRLYLPKDAQAKEIAALKKRIQRLERRKISRPTGLKRLRKGRSIKDIDADVDVSLVDETQERQDDDLMFDTKVDEVDEAELKKLLVIKKDEDIAIDAYT